MTTVLAGHSAVAVAPLAPGVWRATEARDGRSVVAAAIIALGDRTVVVDALEGVDAGAALRAAAEAIGPVALVVLTHRHADHTGGVRAFADVPAVASEVTCAAIGRGAALDGTLRLREGERRVELLSCGAAHTEGDVAVHIADAAVLVAGDLVVAGIHPRLRHGDLEGWIAALDRLGALAPRSVLPGHGDPCGPEALESTAAYLRRVRAGDPEPLPGLPDPHVHAANLASLKGAR